MVEIPTISCYGDALREGHYVESGMLEILAKEKKVCSGYVA